MKHSAFLLYIIFSLPAFCLHAQQIKIGNHTFPGGGEYQGEMFKGKPYGTGKTVYPMAIIMRDSMSKVNVKVKEYISLPMARSMMANGSRISSMARAFITLPITIATKVFGSAIISKVKARCITTTAISI